MVGAFKAASLETVQFAKCSVVHQYNTRALFPWLMLSAGQRLLLLLVGLP